MNNLNFILLQEKNEGGEKHMAIFSPAVSAALAIGLAAIGSGYAIGKAGSASAGAIAENPDIGGLTIIYVAFAEAVAIYGLLVGLLILFTVA